MRVRLTFFEGSLAGESRDVEISADRGATVGRGSHCDVVLGEADRTASSSHAKLWIKDGALYVTDIGSQYGLFVNGKAKMKARLAGSERIQFGFKGPAAIVTVGVAGPSAPAAPRRRPSRKMRPVAMTTVRAVPTDLLKAESGAHRAAPKPPCPICRKELPRSYFRCLGCKQTVCTSHFDAKAAVCSHCAAAGQTLSSRRAAPAPVPRPVPAPAPPRTVVTAPAAGSTPPPSDWKSCPFCAEMIRRAAIKCRFCGEFLSAAPAGASGGGQPPAFAGPAPPVRGEGLVSPAPTPSAPASGPPRVPATGVETFEVIDVGEPGDELELVDDETSDVVDAAEAGDDLELELALELAGDETPASEPLLISRPLLASTPPAASAPPPSASVPPPASQGTIVGMPTFEDDELAPDAARGEVELVPEPAHGASAPPRAAQGTIVGMPTFEDDELAPDAARGEVELVPEPAHGAPPLAPRAGAPQDTIVGLPAFEDDGNGVGDVVEL